MPGPCAAPHVIIFVFDAFFKPFRRIECQFSEELPWKAKEVRNCFFNSWNRASLSGGAEMRRYWNGVLKASIRSLSCRGAKKDLFDATVHFRRAAASADIDDVFADQEAPS
mmetsp:Transcript_1061/g.2464  ORF Transcript_1061/g.2464 Transcript_1061/m.2464 type:complete len:111 (+) Transcript_1061:409-741(+)